jgi:uncharacterized membrane protein
MLIWVITLPRGSKPSHDKKLRSELNMKLRTMIWNGIFAALYIAVSMLIQPFGFGAVQFRISEMFNHLVVFNKKYIYGIVLGVFMTNLLFSELGVYDLVFGVGQSIIALLATIFSMRWIKSIWLRMALNTLIFTFTMFIIAYELHLVFDLPFYVTWLTTAISECIVMMIGAPIMYALNQRLDLANRL